jgi:hypothetical protein
MSRDERKRVITEIEALRGSRVLSYVTGDRAPTPAQIGDDAVRPIYDQLRKMGHVERLDVFLYSRGGAIDVPWRIATSLRTAADEWNILIPFRANSAATLLALGADEIVLGRQGELGPIDPIMSIQRLVPGPGGGQGTPVQDNVNVEDVMAYVKFTRDRAGLSDQQALVTGLSKLTDRLDAVALGSAYRTHSHIRDVARRMLLSRSKPTSEQDMATIIETLAERVYAHGHAIGLRDAEQIGLPVTGANDSLDDAMWRLLNVYEDDLKLLEPIDPAAATAEQDLYTEQSVISVVETTAGGHEFTGETQIQAKRQVPPNLNVALNLNVQLPVGLEAQQLPQAMQAMLQQFQQALVQQAQQAVQQALKDQAPIAGFEAGLRGGRWAPYD